VQAASGYQSATKKRCPIENLEVFRSQEDCGQIGTTSGFVTGQAMMKNVIT
jgi:hypothetical protein